MSGRLPYEDAGVLEDVLVGLAELRDAIATGESALAYELVGEMIRDLRAALEEER